jgi:hypothetical protein
MDPAIFESARRHGISDEDMLHAYRNSIWDWQRDDDFRMLVGPASDGKLLEVGVTERFEVETIIHAMLVRPMFLPKVF